MTTKMTMAALALTALTACDNVWRPDRSAERTDGLYKSAMEDYRAGRLDAAIAGFEKVLRKSPGNASARFQLACLLQDAKKDYLNAFCALHEYLQQNPSGDKVAMARTRLGFCEKEMARALSSRFGFNNAETVSAELAHVRGELKAAEERVTVSEKNVGAALARVRALVAERDRLVAMVRGTFSEDAKAKPAPSVKDARALLEEEDAAETAAVVEQPAAPDIQTLKKEEAEELAEGSSLLNFTNRPPVVTNVAPAKKEGWPKPPLEAKPPRYTVREGDTLIKLAKRFYGRSSAWWLIRDANREVVPPDNRLRVGTVLKMP